MALFFTGVQVLIMSRAGGRGPVVRLLRPWRGYFYAAALLRWPWQRWPVSPRSRWWPATAQLGRGEPGHHGGRGHLRGDRRDQRGTVGGAFTWVGAIRQDLQKDAREQTLNGAERGQPPGSRRRWPRTRACTSSCSPRPGRPGILDERQRMAREIHDTLAQGLTGIITQLQAAEQAADARRAASALRRRRPSWPAKACPRPGGRSTRCALSRWRPDGCGDVLADVARRWSALHGVPAQVTTTGTARPMRPTPSSRCCGPRRRRWPTWPSTPRRPGSG